MPEEKHPGFPNLLHDEEEQATRPMRLEEYPRLAIVRQHHERVAKAIEVFWGHKDCVEYLQQLILSGGDGVGKARIGFKREVLSALINLTTLHDGE